MIRIIRSSEKRELARLRQKLSLNEGLVTDKSRLLTKKVFGKELPPVEVVRRIIRDVKSRGDKAVVEYCFRLDGAKFAPEDLRLKRPEIRKAFKAVDRTFIRAVKKARENIIRYQEMIMYAMDRKISGEGLNVRLKVEAVEKAGIYIPGGTALYPSSVLMNVVPAFVAGVRHISLCTPSNTQGRIDPHILVAADICGVDDIYRAGGVQSLAAMAFGTGCIGKVDKIVGPGNLFVQLAKKELYGYTDIDIIAGPSEVLIIADGSADPEFAAYDLMAQAEHYPGSAVLLTPDRDFAKAVAQKICRCIDGLSRNDKIYDDLRDFSLIVVTKDLKEAVHIANEFAPEHLQICVRNPESLVRDIRNAGAIFMGSYTPVAVGDYFAGPSHTLPTGGTARFFSGVSVNDFLRTTAVISTDQEYIRKYADLIGKLADVEGLTAHKASVMVRRDRQKK
jgi:histidinol dehydrogenase